MWRLGQQTSCFHILMRAKAVLYRKSWGYNAYDGRYCLYW